jgi:hypothetical protein
MSFLGRFVDERFLEHRRRSTSIAGVVGGYLAVGLFAWHYYVDHYWSWDLHRGRAHDRGRQARPHGLVLRHGLIRNEETRCSSRRRFNDRAP